jgi:hypothetical protein
MRDINTQEAAVLGVLKTITLNKDGKAFQVPVIYANYDRLEMFVTKTIKADGVIELKNDPFRLPVIGFQTTTIQRNALKFEGWVLAETRQELNNIVQQMYCLEVEDNMGNNNFAIRNAKIKEAEIGGQGGKAVWEAKFRAVLNM